MGHYSLFNVIRTKVLIFLSYQKEHSYNIKTFPMTLLFPFLAEGRKNCLERKVLRTLLLAKPNIFNQDIVGKVPTLLWPVKW